MAGIAYVYGNTDMQLQFYDHNSNWLVFFFRKEISCFKTFAFAKSYKIFGIIITFIIVVVCEATVMIDLLKLYP